MLQPASRRAAGERLANSRPLYYSLPMRTLMLIAVVVFAGCSKKEQPAQPAEERVYVSDEDGGNVIVISTTTDAVIARIPVGKRPRGLRVSPDGTRLFVALSGLPKAGPGVNESQLPPADPSADGIGIVDLSALKLLRVIPGGKDPELFDVTGDGKRLWVSNEDTAEASLVDIEAGQVVKRVPVGKEPEGVTVRPDGKVVYVTSEEENQVVAVDTRSLKVLAQIATGPRPRGIAFTHDGKTAFASSENGALLTVIDVAKNAPDGTIKVEPKAKTVLGPRPMGLVFSPDGKELFVSNGRGESVAVVDVAARKVARLYDGVGARPWGIGVSRDGKWIFTANGPSGDVSVIDAATGKIEKRIKIGGLPWGLAVGP
jgi:YVTN family beta-propeller protein